MTPVPFNSPPAGWGINGLPVTIPTCGISSRNIHWPENVDAAGQRGELKGTGCAGTSRRRVANARVARGKT